MKIESQNNTIVLKEVYNSIILETKEGKQLCICMRDDGFEMKLNDGSWHLIQEETDFVKKKSSRVKKNNSSLKKVNPTFFFNKKLSYAQNFCGLNNLEYRIVSVNGKGNIVTQDLNLDRYNFELLDGVIVNAFFG